MATELESLEIELKRTQLLREQLALRDDLNRRMRIDKTLVTTQAIGAAGITSVKAARAPAIRALLFAAYWFVNTAICYLILPYIDVAKVGGSIDGRLTYYFFWAVGGGLALALLEYPWKNRGAVIDRKVFGK